MIRLSERDCSLWIGVGTLAIAAIGCLGGSAGMGTDGLSTHVGDYDLTLRNGVRIEMAEVLSEGAGHHDCDGRGRGTEVNGRYWIGKTEITVAQWQAVRADCPDLPEMTGEADMPVTGMSFLEAEQFCEEVTRLAAPAGWKVAVPSEKEWMYACAGGHKCRLPFDAKDDRRFSSMAWHAGNSGNVVHPVAKRLPNELGLFDMYGNVDEYCRCSGGKGDDDGDGGEFDFASYFKVGPIDFYTLGGNYKTDMDGCLRDMGLRICRDDCLQIQNKAKFVRGPRRSNGGTGLRVVLVPVADAEEEEILKRRVVMPSLPTGVEGLTVTLPGGVRLEMVRIKAGAFEMGSTRNEHGGGKDGAPRMVTVERDFWIGRCEVTQEQWMAIMAYNPSRFQMRGRHPVERVSWYEAMRFCEKLNQISAVKRQDGYRFSLPSRAQWEYACRAGCRAPLYNGKDLTSPEGRCGNLDPLAWYGENSLGSTRPVAQKTPNAWGLHDMLGNVAEWCSDVKQIEVVEGAPDSVVCWGCLRGGSYSSCARDCHVAASEDYFAERFGPAIGFRLALVPERSGSQEMPSRATFGQRELPTDLFDQAICRYNQNLLIAGINNWRAWTTADMTNLSGASLFCAQVELSLLIKRRAETMSDEEWSAFMASHRKWLEWYEAECEKTFLDENGVELGGTMVIPMFNGRALDLLMKYLDTFPERVPLEYDFRKEED